MRHWPARRPVAPRRLPTTCTSRETSLPTCTTTKRRRHPPRRRPTESTKRLHSPSWLTNNTVTAAIRRRPTMLRRESRRIIRNQRPAISFNRPESSSPPSNNNNNNGRASVSSPSAASSSATPSPQFPHQSAGVNLSVAASAAAETGSSFNSNCRRRLDYSAPRTWAQKPYGCEVCNYWTTTKDNLSIHMQSDKHLNKDQQQGPAEGAAAPNYWHHRRPRPAPPVLPSIRTRLSRVAIGQSGNNWPNFNGAAAAPTASSSFWVHWNCATSSPSSSCLFRRRAVIEWFERHRTQNRWSVMTGEL